MCHMLICQFSRKAKHGDDSEDVSLTNKIREQLMACTNIKKDPTTPPWQKVDMRAVIMEMRVQLQLLNCKLRDFAQINKMHVDYQVSSFVFGEFFSRFLY